MSKRSSVISSAEGAGEQPTTPSVKLWAAASSTLDESTLHQGMTQLRTACAFLKHQSRSKPSLYRLPSTWCTMASLSLARCAALVYYCKCVRLMCACSCISRLSVDFDASVTEAFAKLQSTVIAKEVGVSVVGVVLIWCAYFCFRGVRLLTQSKAASLCS
jgi:hypothetical protein